MLCSTFRNSTEENGSVLRWIDQEKKIFLQRYVKGEEIKANFEDAYVGDIQRLPGKINGV